MKHIDFWQGDRGILNIKPKRIGELWESFDAISLISNLVGKGSVVEVGCGQGRFSRSFSPTQYIGVDINEAAIDIARKENSDYEFVVIKDYSEIPDREVMLLHSVALHIPDDEINFLFSQANKKIVLAETMGPRQERKKARNENLAYHYARTAKEYRNLLKEWKLLDTMTKNDSNSGKLFTYMVFEK